MAVNKKYGPYALQLYLYLAKNADEYMFSLSPEAAREEAGIAKTSFHKYVNLLIDEGYLVWRKGKIYDFYETPHKQEEKEMERLPCGESLSSQWEQENLPHEPRSSWENSNRSQSNKEIDNTHKNIETDNIKTRTAEKMKKTESRFVF